MGFLNSIFLFIILSKIFNQFVLHPVHAGVNVMEYLVQGHTVISHDSTSYLVSAGGNFTLGFFEIPSSNFIYLGIWYSDNYDQKVWVANRDKPIIGNAVLTIEDSGTLNIVDGGGTPLFNVINNQVGSHHLTSAVLEDSGNFLVFEYYNGTYVNNRTIWQAFDHPTDTLLPGMKLGYNLTTKQNWTLTSWLSDQVPASGAFTIRLEEYQNSPQLLIHRRGELYWVSGPWKNGTFRFLDSFLGNPDPPPHYYLDLISDASGMYITVQPTTSTLRLTADGLVVVNDPSNIEKKFCYGYQGDDGCVVSTVPVCQGQNDIFRLTSGNWDFGPQIIDNNSSISISDCMERCWNDCECVGFITNSNGTGCKTWVKQKHMHFEEDIFHKIQEKYVLVSQNTPQIKTWMWILVPPAIVLTSVLAACLCYVWKRKRRLSEEEKMRRDDIIHQLTGSYGFNYGDELVKGIKDDPDVKIFSLRAILAATSNFSNENKLGQGGYGPVYKGKLFDGREIAVKRLSKTSGQGIEEFKNELILISKLQHTNLVRLYGCCIHQEENMLIYEFMPNKSLDFFLFDDDKKGEIDWRIRFSIIEGIAQGLLYLHKYSRMRVIHRDLKVSNVLLDQTMIPKIADFGMARIFQQNVTKAMTKRVVGTYGYMAPEYVMHGTFSIKSDVFSFGVLILELISGKRNSNFDLSLSLVGYAWELWKRDAAVEMKDEALGESCEMKQLLRSIHVGLLCVQEYADDRPTMSEVISMLNNEIIDLPNPKQPAFLTQAIEVQSKKHLLDKYNIQISVNTLTLTTMEAR